MKREPSIHITESQLAIAMQRAADDSSVDFLGHANWKDMARQTLVEAKTQSLSRRSLYSSNAKLQQKADKVKLIGRSETGIFAQILLLTRRKIHHKGLHLIQPNDPEWIQLKETAKLATEFCNEFELTMKEGYTIYLQIGINKMKNFTIHKFKSMHASICKFYETSLEIESDKTPEKTSIFYNLYIAKVNEKLGWENNDYKENPEKYVCFVKAKELAVKFGIKPTVYINAQFAGMEWGDKAMIPDPLQLYGDKAIERVRRYCYEHNITIREQKTIDFKKLKNEKNR